MDTLFLLVYTNTFVTILASIAVGTVIACVISRFKKTKSFYQIIFSFSLITYFAVIFSPIPPPIERQIIQMLDLLEQNNVESNRTINTVLWPCMSKDFKGVRGMHVNEIRESFKKDMDDQIKKVGMFKAEDNPLMNKENDLCDIAWEYNKIKNKR